MIMPRTGFDTTCSLMLMPSRFLWNGVQREGVTSSPGLHFGLFCSALLYNTLFSEDSIWHPNGLCCKNSRGNTTGVKPRFLLSLGSHSKQAGDERNLPHDVPLFDATHLPFPDHVHDLISL